MLNFGELVDQIAVLADRDQDTTYKTYIKHWINIAQMFAFNIYDYWAELEETHNFTTVASTEDYFMPNNFDKPLRIKDLTNKKTVNIVTEQEYVDANVSAIADATTIAAPNEARLYGVSPVIRQISTSGDTLQAKSSASESGNNVTVRVGGYVDSNLTIADFEDITVTGTSATTASSPKTFYKITHVSKDIDSVGYVTLEDSSGNDLSIIPTSERLVRHKVLKLGRIPSQANSMRIWFKSRIRRLVDDGDYPFIDADDYFIMYSFAISLMEQRENIGRGQVMLQEAKELLKGVITNQQARLGPEHQHKLVASILSAHRA